MPGGLVISPANVTSSGCARANDERGDNNALVDEDHASDEASVAREDLDVAGGSKNIAEPRTGVGDSRDESTPEVEQTREKMLDHELGKSASVASATSTPATADAIPRFVASFEKTRPKKDDADE